ncbi:MAG: DUF4249 domain-containing protein [Bacteroidota bacterium]
MKRLIVPIILISILMYGCTENMDIKLDSTYTRLIVDASISTDTTIHKVMLSKTASYFDSSNPLPVTGAVITIDDGINTFPLTENNLTPGLYETTPNVYGVVGKTYNLTIKNVDINNDGVTETYNASSTINYVTKIDSIQAPYKGNNPDRMSYQILLFAQDPPTQDYYMFEIYKNGVLQTDTLREVRFSDDALFNGNYVYGLPVGSLRDRKGAEQGHPGDVVTVEMRSITKDYYNFLTGALLATSPQIPLFSGPPANVKGNINNGAFGFFAAYSSSRASCVLK